MSKSGTSMKPYIEMWITKITSDIIVQNLECDKSESGWRYSLNKRNGANSHRVKSTNSASFLQIYLPFYEAVSFVLK